MQTQLVLCEWAKSLELSKERRQIDDSQSTVPGSSFRLSLRCLFYLLRLCIVNKGLNLDIFNESQAQLRQEERTSLFLRQLLMTWGSIEPNDSFIASSIVSTSETTGSIY